MSPVVVICVRCHSCSRHVPPADAIRHSGGFVQCLRCHQHHIECLMSIATGRAPRECGQCQTPFETLSAQDPEGNVKMTAHLKDGIYQFLCARCSPQYTRKRLDLYADTEYGWATKLKGAR